MLYTDGLVERRDETSTRGSSAAGRGPARQVPLEDAPEALVAGRLPEGPDDDVAVLVARPTAATDAP